MNKLRTLLLSWDKIQLICLKQGKSLQELASETGLSRTTLNNWAKGKITKPHSQKITAIAAALNVSVEEILTNVPGEDAGSAQALSIKIADQDRLHNKQIEDVLEQQPDLFQQWTTQNWDELYSEFGVGGALTSQGVKRSADQINRKKLLFHKLEIVLESDLADLAEAMIQNFYNKIQANPDARSNGSAE